MKIKKSRSMVIFQSIAYVLLALGAVVCVLPFLIILSGSVTDNAIIMKEGYSILPRKFSMAAYEAIFKAPEEILQAYKMTIFYTVAGTAVGLFMTTLTAYVISRKEFKYRNQVSFLIYFTTLFGGGLIPWYLMYMNVLNLKGSTFPIWFPGVMSPFLIILMRTFISDSVPDAITESAKLDGAGQFTIFYRIVLPVLGPGLATVGLFLALGFWNDWYRSSLFSTDQKTWELQFYLSNMLNMSTSLRQIAVAGNTSISTEEVPTQSMNLAMAVVVTGPVLLFYPFVQRYFVSGTAEVPYGLSINYDTPMIIDDYWFSDDFVEDMKLMKKWADLGFWSRSVLSNTPSDASFGNGLCVMLASGYNPAKAMDAKKNLAEDQPDWEAEFIAFGEKNGVIFPANMQANGTSISKDCKNPERAMKVLELLLTDPELNVLVQNGIEGEHYEVDENGYYQNLSDRFTGQSLNTWNLRNSALAINSESGDKLNELFKKYEELGAKTKFPNTDIWGGFTEDNSAYMAEASAVENVMNQYLKPLQVGIVDDVDATVAEFREKLTAAGLDACREGFKEQWLSYCEEYGYK